MKVLLFTNLYPSLREPTRGLFNLNKFRALAERCEVRAVVPVPAWKRISHPMDLLRPVAEAWDGIRATYPSYLAVPRVAPQWHAEGMYQSVRSHVRKLHGEFPFDVIISVFAYPDVVAAARLAEDMSCPLVAIVVGSDMNELARMPALRGRIRGALLQASSVIAVSRGLRDKVVELGIPANRIVVQHNGVDGERFVIRDRLETRRGLGLPEDVPLVCCVGNLVPEKGPDILVEAVGRFDVAGLARARVVFIGDGRLSTVLVARAAALGVGERCSFLGRLPPDEVALWLSASDVLCLPSRREGCPNVVLEALAAGRPVVAAAVGGVPELLDERNGVLVPPDDPSALASAIGAVLQRAWDPAALRATVGSLSWHEVARTVYRVLDHAVGTGRQARYTADSNQPIKGT